MSRKTNLAAAGGNDGSGGDIEQLKLDVQEIKMVLKEHYVTKDHLHRDYGWLVLSIVLSWLVYFLTKN